MRRAIWRLKNRAAEASRHSPSKMSPAKQREGYSFLQRLVHQRLERLAARRAEPFRQPGIAQAQALEGAPQMQVGGVEKGKAHEVPQLIRAKV